MKVTGVTITSMSDHVHHRSMLVISAKRPTRDVLDEIMSPWLADPPWANKEIRIRGYALGGDFRGWLIPRDGADVIVGSQSMRPLGFYSPRLFHSDGVDAVRVCELQSAERCSRFYAKSKGPRQRKFRSYKAPRCEVLVPRNLITDAKNWRYPTADRPCGVWLNINEGTCDDDRIATIIGDIPPDYWLAVVDCWDQWN